MVPNAELSITTHTTGSFASIAVAITDVWQGLRHHVSGGRIARQVIRSLAYPLFISAVVWWAAPLNLPLLVQAALTLALVTPFGPLIYRLAYERLADATVLVSKRQALQSPLIAKAAKVLEDAKAAPLGIVIPK